MGDNMTKLRLKKKFRIPLKSILLLVLIYGVINLGNFLIPNITNNKKILSFILNNSGYLMDSPYKIEVTSITKYITNLNINDPISILNKSTGYNISLEKKETKQEETKEIKEQIVQNKKVYIYNTHQTENYSDSKTVKDASYMLKEHLSKLNIDTTVEEGNISEFLTINNWNYDYSYLASKYFIEENIKNNNYDLIIDLHRDSIDYTNSVTNIEGKNYARILFVVGKENPNYEKNLALMQQLNDMITNKYPTLTRGVIQKEGYGVNGIYNQDINDKIILLEVGGYQNNSEEVNNTLEIIANIIKEKIGE